MDAVTIGTGAFLAYQFLIKKGNDVNKASRNYSMYDNMLNKFGKQTAQEVNSYPRGQRVPLAVVLAVMYTESAGNPNAEGDGGNSIGLFQIQRLALMDAHLFNNEVTDVWEELFDPIKNIKAGVSYLNWLYSRTQDVDEAVIAFNIGIGKVLNVRRGVALSKTDIDLSKKYLSTVWKHQKGIQPRLVFLGI